MARPALQWADPIELEDGRTTDYRFALYDSDRSPLAIAAGDVVRFKLSEEADSEEPTLELTSAEATANGSSITIVTVGVAGTTPAEVLVRFAQGDTDGLARNDDYYGELLLVDDSETEPADAVKRCGYGPVTVLPAAGGDVGLT
jgi:hypothetical protein